MIQAVKERILVRIVEIKKEKGILIMPDDKKDYQIGHVVSTGADLVDPTGINEIAVGDYVYTRKYAGLLVEFKGEEYVSLDIKEILAVSEELG